MQETITELLAYLIIGMIILLPICIIWVAIKLIVRAFKSSNAKDPEYEEIHDELEALKLPLDKFGLKKGQIVMYKDSGICGHALHATDTDQIVVDFGYTTMSRFPQDIADADEMLGVK